MPAPVVLYTSQAGAAAHGYSTARTAPSRVAGPPGRPLPLWRSRFRGCAAPRLAGTCRYQTRLPRSLPGLWEELPEGRRPAPSAPPRTSSRAAGATGKGPTSGSGGPAGGARGEERSAGKDWKDPGARGWGGGTRAPSNLNYLFLMSAGFWRPDGRTRSKDWCGGPAGKKMGRSRRSPSMDPSRVAPFIYIKKC